MRSLLQLAVAGGDRLNSKYKSPVNPDEETNEYRGRMADYSGRYPVGDVKDGSC
jgi:hypothetical protein